MDLAKRIVKIRQQKGYSTTKLAKLAGIAQSTLREIELGNTSPTWDTIKKLCKALEISQLNLLSPDSSETQDSQSPPTEVHRHHVIEKIKKLPPDKFKALESVLDTWVDSNAHLPANDKNVPSITYGMNTGPIYRVAEKEHSQNEWYIEKIRNGQPLSDANFLCRLLGENVIKPTIYGHPLTPEQKEGLIGFIKSNKELLITVFDNNNKDLPGNYAAHKESQPLDLTKKPELAVLIKISDIINEMLHRYLKTK